MAKIHRVSAVLKDWCKLVFLFTGLQKCEREKCWNFKETSLTSTWCTEYPCIARHAGIFNEFNPSNLFLISTVCEVVTIIQIIITLQFMLKSNYTLQHITLQLQRNLECWWQIPPRCHNLLWRSDSLMMPTRIIMKMDNKDEDDKEQLIMIKTKRIWK